MTVTERIQRARRTGKNVGGTERLVRATLGPSLIAVGAAAIAGLLTIAPGSGGLAAGAVLVLAGARMTQTAVTQRCYLNALLGRNSCRYEPVADEAATVDEA